MQIYKAHQSIDRDFEVKPLTMSILYGASSCHLDNHSLRVLEKGSSHIDLLFYKPCSQELIFFYS